MNFNKNGDFIITSEEIIHFFSQALKRLINEDSFLLKSGVQERSIQFKLGVYLRELFSFAECGGLNIDVEYNRDGKSNVKRPNPDCEHFSKNKWIAPDIILHERGSADFKSDNKYKNDIIFCEIKKNGKNNPKRIKEQMKIRKYKYGIDLYLLTPKKISLDLYTQDNIQRQYEFNFKTQMLEEIKQYD